MGYRVRLFVLLVATVLLAPVAVTAQVATPVPAIPATFGYRVVNEYPHDRHAVTEGLAYVDGVLYEGTGLYGESTLRRVAFIRTAQPTHAGRPKSSEARMLAKGSSLVP